MFAWCTLLFMLGVAAFLDSIFNYGDIFRRINSVVFMLVSLGILVRTTTKMRMRITENYLEKIAKLENEVKSLKGGQETKAPAPVDTF